MANLAQNLDSQVTPAEIAPAHDGAIVEAMVGSRSESRRSRRRIRAAQNETSTPDPVERTISVSRILEVLAEEGDSVTKSVQDLERSKPDRFTPEADAIDHMAEVAKKVGARDVINRLAARVTEEGAQVGEIPQQPQGADQGRP